MSFVANLFRQKLKTKFLTQQALYTTFSTVYENIIGLKINFDQISSFFGNFAYFLKCFLLIYQIQKNFFMNLFFQSDFSIFLNVLSRISADF